MQRSFYFSQTQKIQRYLVAITSEKMNEFLICSVCKLTHIRSVIYLWAELLSDLEVSVIVMMNTLGRIYCSRPCDPSTS